MIKVIKECKGVMCEKKCCANCWWFRGNRPDSDVNEYYYYQYKGWCAADSDKPDVTGDDYCSRWSQE